MHLPLLRLPFGIQYAKVDSINGKLSDAQSDVQKTTGLNKEEVDELTKSFGLWIAVPVVSTN